MTAFFACLSPTLPAPAPTASPSAAPAPSASPAASAANEPENQQKQHRADRGVDDRSDNAHANVDAELRQQPVADEGAYDSDDEVADDPIPRAAHDLAGQPSCNDADQQDDEETFTRHDTLSRRLIRRPEPFIVEQTARRGLYKIEHSIDEIQT